MWDFSTLQFVRCRPSDGVSYETASADEIPLQNSATRRRKESLLAAIALHWNDGSVTVLCPFCSKTHNRGITHFRHHGGTGCRIQDDWGRYSYDGPSPTRCDSRKAHCEEVDSNVKIEYVIIFPFENDARVSGGLRSRPAWDQLRFQSTWSQVSQLSNIRSLNLGAHRAIQYIRVYRLLYSPSLARKREDGNAGWQGLYMRRQNKN
jgi:hypothetical protein